ncbi:MAG: hypothetical protein JXQ99_25225 [Hyphomicrobiaceae bacterium]
MTYVRSRFIAGIVAITVFASLVGSAFAERIATQGRSLGGLSDRQCVRKVDRIIERERQSPNYVRTVRADFTRRVFYEDGSVDFACFPDQVVVIVYFVNAGERRAERDLRRFLKAL